MSTPRRITAAHGVIALALLIAGLAVFFIHDYVSTLSPSYSQFKQWASRDEVSDLTITETTIKGTFKPKADGEQARAFRTGRVSDPELVPLLEDHRIEFKGT